MLQSTLLMKLVIAHSFGIAEETIFYLIFGIGLEKNGRKLQT